MLRLDHLTVIAPSLDEGVEHVSECLGIKVPFGTRHHYMGTHNHRLQLGGNVYLEIVALDPDGVDPGRPRWFGLDDRAQVRSDWEQKRRLRGWVAAVASIEGFIRKRPEFGEVVPLPFTTPEFAFAVPVDGSLPLGGILPSLIDHQGDPTRMSDIPDLGARLASFTLQHPEPEEVVAIYARLKIDRPPEIRPGPVFRYQVEIETPNGLRTLW
ncbi:MAG: VOC family protein [Rhodobacteraceae bacterium]|nr:VOC family protein [Paracoccaceae bacterium]